VEGSSARSLTEPRVRGFCRRRGHRRLSRGATAARLGGLTAPGRWDAGLVPTDSPASAPAATPTPSSGGTPVPSGGRPTAPSADRSRRKRRARRHWERPRRPVPADLIPSLAAWARRAAHLRKAATLTRPRRSHHRASTATRVVRRSCSARTPRSGSRRSSGSRPSADGASSRWERVHGRRRDCGRRRPRVRGVRRMAGERTPGSPSTRRSSSYRAAAASGRSSWRDIVGDAATPRRGRPSSQTERSRSPETWR
jgi:hypothetical protein